MQRACLVVCAWQQVWDGVLLQPAGAGVLCHPGYMCGGRCQIQQLHFMRGDVSMHTIGVVCIPSECQLRSAAMMHVGRGQGLTADNNPHIYFEIYISCCTLYRYIGYMYGIFSLNYQTAAPVQIV